MIYFFRGTHLINPIADARLPIGPEEEGVGASASDGGHILQDRRGPRGVAGREPRVRGRASGFSEEAPRPSMVRCDTMTKK